jgi:hypothetical protein
VAALPDFEQESIRLAYFTGRSYRQVRPTSTSPKAPSSPASGRAYGIFLGPRMTSGGSTPERRLRSFHRRQQPETLRICGGGQRQFRGGSRAHRHSDQAYRHLGRRQFPSTRADWTCWSARTGALPHLGPRCCSNTPMPSCPTAPTKRVTDRRGPRQTHLLGVTANRQRRPLPTR